MKKVEQGEIQSLLLDILKAFKIYAQKNGIFFSLAYGTAIGAVRHKGFIPWDDDIDVFVSHKDQDKLVELAKEDPFIDDEKRYKILVPCDYPNSEPFIKIIDTYTVLYERNVSKKYALGLYVDVFCLSYYPDSIKESLKRIKKFKLCKLMNRIIIGGHYSKLKYKIIGPFVWPVRQIMLLLGWDSAYWNRKVVEMDTLSKSGYLGNVSFPVDINDRFEASWFNEFTDVTFEGETFKIEKEYDKTLTQLYRDYMTLPPVEKRVRHDAEVYWVKDIEK